MIGLWLFSKGSWFAWKVFDVCFFCKALYTCIKNLCISMICMYITVCIMMHLHMDKFNQNLNSNMIILFCICMYLKVSELHAHKLGRAELLPWNLSIFNWILHQNSQHPTNAVRRCTLQSQQQTPFRAPKRPKMEPVLFEDSIRISSKLFKLWMISMV